MDDKEVYRRLKAWTVLWIICVVAAFVAGYMTNPQRDAPDCMARLKWVSESRSTLNSAADAMSFLLADYERNQTQYRQIIGLEVTPELCKEHCAGLGLEYGRHEPRYCYCLTEIGVHEQWSLEGIKETK